MAALVNGNELAGKIMTGDGFHYTESDVEATIAGAWLEVRNLCAQVTNLPEDVDQPKPN